jgi:outer membrane protein OmpA-like peptidoglycan-associated protein
MFFETETTGYFSSNRPKGKGDDDIYSFVKQEESCISNYTIKTIQLNEDFPISEVKILVVDGFGDVVKELETDSSGEVKFNFPCSKEFSIKTEKIDYDVYEAERKDFEINEDKSFSLDVRMYKPSTLFKTTKNGEEQLRLDPIYFELDKWAITEESKIILNQVVNIMNSFPDMVIKIESHTDSRDSQDFNLILSNKRAIATSNYIINEGISPERIESAVGYGEYRLINGCADDVHCSEKEHLENRRSEFIVVKR